MIRALSPSPPPSQRPQSCSRRRGLAGDPTAEARDAEEKRSPAAAPEAGSARDPLAEACSHRAAPGPRPGVPRGPGTAGVGVGPPEP